MKERKALLESPSPATQSVVAGLRIGKLLETDVSQALQTFGVTLLQYTVLRILYVRDPAREGMTVGELKDRLIGTLPDVTRLVDRLVKAELAQRARSRHDRRVVKVSLTDPGHDLVESIHEALVQHHEALLADIPREDLETFVRLSERMLKALA